MVKRFEFAGVVLYCFLAVSGYPLLAQAPAEPQAPKPASPPAQNQRRSAAEDRRLMLELLGLPTSAKQLPTPAEDPNRPRFTTQKPGSPTNWFDEAGNVYIRSGLGTWSNYDETKANPYLLPDPLNLKDGTPVTDEETWWTKRRPEILNDFLTEIYGRIPANAPKVTWELMGTDTNALRGRAVAKSLVGRIDNSAYPAAAPSIPLLLYIPARATGPVPVLVVVSGSSERRFLPVPPKILAQILSVGWGCAAVNTNEIQPDHGSRLTSGVIGLVNQGQPRKPDDWGVLAAWSWGLSRVFDYLETDNAVDSKRIGIQGHSRWGKAALLSAALDQRWAIVYSSCSGIMGAKLARRNWGETVDNAVGAAEYHWMAGNFLKYGGRWSEMPVDAHELIALVAPRPVFITGGTLDQWSDPRGHFLACVAAAPVYRLLGKNDLGTTEMPAPDVALDSGDIAFRLHEGGHDDKFDWPPFLAFAQRYFTRTNTN